MNHALKRFLPLFAAVFLIVSLLSTTAFAAGSGSSNLIDCPDCGGIGACMECCGLDPACETCGGENLCPTVPARARSLPPATFTIPSGHCCRR